MKNYLSAGELARLACTTKRTIHFYDELGILKPVKVDSNGYRKYAQEQVLDYQRILLLTTLGVYLKEIEKYLKKQGDLSALFFEKKALIKQQIEDLKFSLDSLERYSLNLETNRTMVDPKIKVVKPFYIYYIERKGPYSKIGDYCVELGTMLDKKGNKFVSLAIFEDQTYQPKETLIKVAIIANKNMIVRSEYKDEVKYMKFNPGKVITYTHNGSGSLLSLFWKELEKYCRLNKLNVRRKTPAFEIYRKVNQDLSKQFFEIYLPII